MLDESFAEAVSLLLRESKNFKLGYDGFDVPINFMRKSKRFRNYFIDLFVVVPPIPWSGSRPDSKCHLSF